MNVHILEKNGAPEWAILPFSEYRTLLEAQAMLEDIQSYDEACRHPEEAVPIALADRLLQGESPLKVWREYRQFSRAQLAAQCGFTVETLSVWETRQQNPTPEQLQKLAEVLAVDADDL